MAHHMELAFSRDGIHYDRRYREPFTQRGARSEFDCNSIYGRSPLLHGDRILFFYHGLSYRSPETLLALGDKAKGAVGLATLPLDGFVSMDGVGGALSRDVAPYSEMVTRSFGFAGSRLSLNVSAALQGPGPVELRVEVLEPNHHRIDGFQFDDADPITESGQSHVVSWKGSPDLSALVGRAIKLRFYFKNASQIQISRISARVTTLTTPLRSETGASAPGAGGGYSRGRGADQGRWPARGAGGASVGCRLSSSYARRSDSRPASTAASSSRDHGDFKIDKARLTYSGCTPVNVAFPAICAPFATFTGRPSVLSPDNRAAMKANRPLGMAEPRKGRQCDLFSGQRVPECHCTHSLRHALFCIHSIYTSG